MDLCFLKQISVGHDISAKTRLQLCARKTFSASRQVSKRGGSIEEQRVTNRVIYDAAGTGRSCQNDNNRVKMSATATTESSGATTVNVIDDLFDY